LSSCISQVPVPLLATFLLVAFFCRPYLFFHPVFTQAILFLVIFSPNPRFGTTVFFFLDVAPSTHLNPHIPVYWIIFLSASLFSLRTFISNFPLSWHRTSREEEDFWSRSVAVCYPFCLKFLISCPLSDKSSAGVVPHSSTASMSSAFRQVPLFRTPHWVFLPLPFKASFSGPAPQGSFST